MGRWDFYSRGDTIDTVDGDSSFSGVDMTRSRELLAPGTLALAQNVRMRTGAARQRLGTVRPSDFNPIFANRIIGSCVFQDPNGNEQLLVAPASVNYTVNLRYGKDPVQIPYDVSLSTNNGTGGIEFCQAFDKLLLIRRPLSADNPNTLVWDGDNTHKWQQLALSATGLKVAPNSWNAEPFQDRVLYYTALFPSSPTRDTWYMSDIEDYTSYDPVFQVFRTNSGESDYITRIMQYYESSVLIFKSNTIHQSTLLPQFPVAMQHRALTLRLGSIGNKMPLEIGGDIIFLSQPGGFYRLTQVIQENIIALPVALSEPIQPVIDNLQWGVTGLFGCSSSVDNYGFFGVALGVSATRCNAVLVINTQTNKWESVPDTWADPAFGFEALHVTNYNGVKRLFAIDYKNGVVYLMYEGIGDDLKSGYFKVPYKIETRGYTANDPVSFKRFLRATVSISTSAPRINVTALSDGVNEEKVLTPDPITKDRTKFYTHGHKRFDVTTDSLTEELREDYSNPLSEEVAIEDFEQYIVGPVTSLIETDLPIAQDKQESTERLLVRDTGRHMSLRIENTEGVCDVLAVSIEASRSMNTIRTAA